MPLFFPLPDIQLQIYGILIYSLFLLAIFSRSSAKEEKVLLGLFFLASLRSRRFVLPLIVILIPCLISQLDFFWKKIRKNRFLTSLPVFGASASLAIVILLSSFSYLYKAHLAYASPAEYASQMLYPWSLPYHTVVYMQKNGAPSRVLNDFNWGGYLIWHFPGHRFFIDGRMDNFFLEDQSFAQEYFNIINIRPGWEDRLGHYQVNGVLGPKDWPIIQALQLMPDWKVVFEEESAILLEKQISLPNY
jgi:hypothetical protein